MNNIKCKGRIARSALKGRKIFWFGEESEIFVSKSLQALVDEYGLQDPDEPLSGQGGEVSNPEKFLWMQGWDDEHQKATPIISWVYGDEDTICMLSTSYN